MTEIDPEKNRYIVSSFDKQMIINRMINLSHELKNINTDQDFFLFLQKLGCLLNVLFRHRFSTTDCCTTVDTLEELFDPINETKYLKVRDSDSLRNILNDETHNFYMIDVHTDNLFHTFVLLNWNNEWYILQSYVNICQLNVSKDENIYTYLMYLLEIQNVQYYNALFQTDIKTEKLSNIYFDMTAGYIDKLPVEKLKILYTNYLSGS